MSDTLAPSQQTRSRPVLVMAAVLAAAQFIVGGAALVDVLDPKVYGLLALVLGGVQVGWGVYATGQVTPWSSVVAKATPSGGVIAGPAANQETGSPVVVTSPSGEGAAPPADLDNEQGVGNLVVIGAVVAVVGLLIYLLTAAPVIGALGVAIGVILVVAGLVTGR